MLGSSLPVILEERNLVCNIQSYKNAYLRKRTYQISRKIENGIKISLWKWFVCGFNTMRISGLPVS